METVYDDSPVTTFLVSSDYWDSVIQTTSLPRFPTILPGSLLLSSLHLLPIPQWRRYLNTVFLPVSLLGYQPSLSPQFPPVKGLLSFRCTNTRSKSSLPFVTTVTLTVDVPTTGIVHSPYFRVSVTCPHPYRVRTLSSRPPTHRNPTRHVLKRRLPKCKESLHSSTQE